MLNRCTRECLREILTEEPHGTAARIALVALDALDELDPPLKEDLPPKPVDDEEYARVGAWLPARGCWGYCQPRLDEPDPPPKEDLAPEPECAKLRGELKAVRAELKLARRLNAAYIANARLLRRPWPPGSVCGLYARLPFAML